MARRKKEDQKLVTSTGRVFYCNNADMLKELEKWRDSNKAEEEELERKGLPIDFQKRTISEELALMFMQIARRLTNHSSFRNYSTEIKEELQGQAYVKIISGLHHYNFKFKNPFAYITQICFNAYRGVLAQHYKQINIKKDIKAEYRSSMEASGQFNVNSALWKTLEETY